MTADLSALIAKLETAEGGSRELDCRVVAWSEGAISGEPWSDDDLAYALTDPDRTCNPDPVTTSLDAALALAERVLPGWGLGSIIRAYEVGADPSPWYAVMCPAGTGGFPIAGRKEAVQAIAETPAIALCAAILRAHASRAVEGE